MGKMGNSVGGSLASDGSTRIRIGCFYTGRKQYREEVMSKTKKQGINEDGFTLIELLIAILILAVGILGVVGLLSSGYNQVGTSGRVSAMNHLGQQKLDQLRRLPYSDANLTDGLHPTSGPERYTVLDGSGNNVYVEYTVRWDVEDDTPQADMKRVVVEVGHQLYNGNTKLTEDKWRINTKEMRFERYLSR
jgi:prepilin-type N-terminal cleavage/methylation domain-containing protein